jgi:hypothetical protein
MPQQQQRKYSTLRKQKCDAPFICERDPHWQSSHQRDPQIAAQLAGGLLELARVSAQPQLYGRAQSVLTPWDIAAGRTGHSRDPAGACSSAATRVCAGD